MLLTMITPPRLTGLALAGALFAAPVLAGTINSNLQIDPGKTFELGGGQEGGFTVNGRNTGPVTVEVYALGEGAKVPVAKGKVAPGGAVDAAFGPGEQALLRNTSAKEMAQLKLRISGDTSSLGMRYSAKP